MTVSLREEHRDATRRRIVTAARKVFVKNGYTKATIEEITVAAGVSRATLYLHFDSKFALLAAAAEKMSREGKENGDRLARVLADGDRADLRQWIESVLGWYVRNRPMALAAQEAELTEDKPWDALRTYLDCLDPWVETWPPARRAEARMRYELCRLQMYHYMWGNSHALFGTRELPVDLFTELWWNTLKAPLIAGQTAM